MYSLARVIKVLSSTFVIDEQVHARYHLMSSLVLEGSNLRDALFYYISGISRSEVVIIMRNPFRF